MDFNQTAADEICARLARGDSLRKICGSDRDDFIPGQTVVFEWLKDHADFAKQYARARELQADHYVEEIIEIADAPNVTNNLETGEPELRDAQRDRLRVDARKWVASKLAPKKYGDKLELNNNHGVQDSLADLMQRIDGKSRGIPG